MRGILRSGHPRRENPGGCGCWGRPSGTQRAGGESRNVVREWPAVRTQYRTLAQTQSKEGENKLYGDNDLPTPHQRNSSLSPSHVAWAGSLLLGVPGTPPALRRTVGLWPGVPRPQGGSPSIPHRVFLGRERAPNPHLDPKTGGSRVSPPPSFSWIPLASHLSF